jgi:hypothetical protein
VFVHANLRRENSFANCAWSRSPPSLSSQTPDRATTFAVPGLVSSFDGSDTPGDSRMLSFFAAASRELRDPFRTFHHDWPPRR